VLAVPLLKIKTLWKK